MAAISQPLSVKRPTPVSLLLVLISNTTVRKSSSQGTRLQRPDTEVSQPNNVNTQNAHYISQLQNELLQLSLVHQGSAKTMVDFERSVGKKIDFKTRQLRKEEQVVSTLEAEYQKGLNAVSLFEWLQEDAGFNERKVQDLSFCIKELESLREDGQLFQQLMEEFRRWLDKAQEIMPALINNSTYDGDVDVILSLEAPTLTWWHGVEECSRKLELCQRLLNRLGKAESRPGIGIVLARYRDLTAIMLAKIQTAQDIVNAVTASQQQWLSGSLSVALDEAEFEDRLTNRKGVWTKLDAG